ncbi:MAG TPA: cupin domain-containing protein [Longimicrobium sp.]|nr:cupin domain-containing protein [Longimicrobium sp.]
MMDSSRFVHADELGWTDLGGGVQRQILGHDSELMMVRARFEAGAVGARHHHPHRQVTLVESGRFKVEIGGDTRALQAGDSFFIPPNVEHGVVALEAGVLVDVFTPAREDFLGNGEG